MLLLALPLRTVVKVRVVIVGGSKREGSPISAHLLALKSLQSLLLYIFLHNPEDFPQYLCKLEHVAFFRSREIKIYQSNLYLAKENFSREFLSSGESWHQSGDLHTARHSICARNRARGRCAGAAGAAHLHGRW